MSRTEVPPEMSPAPVADSHEEAVFTPVLLSQLQDDLARSRLREAFWISVVVHLIFIGAVLLSPKLMPGARPVQLATAEDMLKDKDLTFLELPPDQQKAPVTPPKDTKYLSDKNRIATSRTPSIDKKTLDELRSSQRPGPPGNPGPPQQNQQQQQAAAMPPAMPSGPSSAPAPQPSQQRGNGMLTGPSQPSGRPNPFNVPMTAGSSISEAARATARGGSGGYGGDYGIPAGGGSKVQSNIDILSDTMGVDFGPYLSRVLQSVRENWYNLIPEIARPPLMRKGKVSIEFVILKDGKVAGMRLIGPSGEVALDRAAWGGITASNPFSPLPGEFRGPYLALRFHFYYNPDKNDLR